MAGVADRLRHVLVDRLAGDDLATLNRTRPPAWSWSVSIWRSSGARAGSTSPAPEALQGLGMLVGMLGVDLATYFVVLPVEYRHRRDEPQGPYHGGRTRPGRVLPHSHVDQARDQGSCWSGWSLPSHRSRAAVIVFPAGRRGPVATSAHLLTRPWLWHPHARPRRSKGEKRKDDYDARGSDDEPDLEAAITYLAPSTDVDAERIGGNLGLSVSGQEAAPARRPPRTGQLSRPVISEGTSTQWLPRPGIQIPDICRRTVRWLLTMTVETTTGVVLADPRAAAGTGRLRPADRAAPRAPD